MIKLIIGICWIVVGIIGMFRQSNKHDETQAMMLVVGGVILLNI